MIKKEGENIKKIIDMHIHSNCSDGELSPKQIIDEAKKNKVSVIAIADHDTVAAYTTSLFDYAKSQGIKLIPAVEMSTKIAKVGFHVLGYNFDLTNKNLLKKLSLLRNSRCDYLNKVANKLLDLGYILNIENLNKIDAVTKAHIALDIISNEKNNELLLKNFGHIPQKGEFIETVMNDGCPAFVNKESITPKEASDLIHNAGGKVVLAHPVAYKYEDNLNVHQILELIKDMNADGIEGNYIYIDKNKNKINEVKFWNNVSKEVGLISTIGSDFHVANGIYPVIGLINEDINLDEKETSELINWIEKPNKKDIL